MKVLMIGATGHYASLLLPELTRRGATVRALIRDESKVAEARGHGAAEIAIGDLRRPETLSKAVEGVDGVFHLGPAFAPDESQMGVTMVEAARAAGVRKFVFSGAIHPSISKLSNHTAKQPVEEALYESGMEFTVLQPAMFMQTLGMTWARVVKEGVIALPFSKRAKVCFVDYRDVAETAAIALTGERLAYGTFELCSAGMVDRVEIAALMSKALGRQIEAAEVPFDQWAEKSKLPQGPLREGLGRMYANYDRYGFPGGNALVLRAILEREPRTLVQYFRELAQQREVAAA
jgi:uncharacterized protein YbjT (DUF2867 family)